MLPFRSLLNHLFNLRFTWFIFAHTLSVFVCVCGCERERVTERETERRGRLFLKCSFLFLCSHLFEPTCWPLCHSCHRPTGSGVYLYQCAMFIEHGINESSHYDMILECIAKQMLYCWCYVLTKLVYFVLYSHIFRPIEIDMIETQQVTYICSI